MPPEGVAINVSKEVAIVGSEDLHQHHDHEAPASSGHVGGDGLLQPSHNRKEELEKVPCLEEVPDPQAEGNCWPSRARGPRDSTAPHTAEAPDGSEVPTTASAATDIAAKGIMEPFSQGGSGDASKGQSAWHGPREGRYFSDM